MFAASQARRPGMINSVRISMAPEMAKDDVSSKCFRQDVLE